MNSIWDVFDKAGDGWASEGSTIEPSDIPERVS